MDQQTVKGSGVHTIISIMLLRISVGITGDTARSSVTAEHCRGLVQSRMPNLHSAVRLEVHERVDDMGDIRRHQIRRLEVASVDAPFTTDSQQLKLFWRFFVCLGGALTSS